MMNKYINFFLIKILLLLFLINNSYAINNKIIFKINDKAFTTLDYELRLQYLDFVGNNKELDRSVIINDFISVNLFYEHFITKTNYDEKKYEIKIKEIFENIYNANEKNNKKYKYKLNINNILINIKLDFYRKLILEEILNSNLNILNRDTKDLDLLYNFTISYINLSNPSSHNLKSEIENLKEKNIENIKIFLNDKKIDFFIKNKEITSIDNLNESIKKNILSNKKFFILDKDNQLTLVFIEKRFETIESIVVDLFSVNSTNAIDKQTLNCQNLINNKNDLKVINKEYKFVNLNDELKNNLISINDYVKFSNNNENIYIVLCNIKFDKKILQNFNLNKLINSSVAKIEKKLIIKYAKIYNLIKINV